MLEKHNRKSHLAPQLSPATQALLKGDNTASPSRESADPTSATRTPTSSEIPIANDNHRTFSTSTSEPPMSARIVDVNGGGIYPEHTPAYDTPNYPPRTSSSLSQSSSRSRAGTAQQDAYAGYPSESSGFNHTLPIRPAPPTGPLPRRPDSSNYNKTTTPNSIAANGSAYPYHENVQYH